MLKSQDEQGLLGGAVRYGFFLPLDASFTKDNARLDGSPESVYREVQRIHAPAR